MPFWLQKWLFEGMTINFWYFFFALVKKNYIFIHFPKNYIGLRSLSLFNLDLARRFPCYVCSTWPLPGASTK